MRTERELLKLICETKLLPDGLTEDEKKALSTSVDKGYLGGVSIRATVSGRIIIKGLPKVTEKGIQLISQT